ncbi:hypothetical protein HCA00_04660 [Listeria booriae]|uniref:hypothetical protein n=1 Tax=Listeria booriae TaxID=1552123 RepID=UPI00164E5D67|nr:hypothetical protein [Listeria booriae]MBC6128074.1 hypothetical protein [Listeria booriae]
MVRFTIDQKDLENILSQIAKIPNQAERLINETLKKEGAPLAIEGITRFIPISTVGLGGHFREKRHAKYSNPLLQRMENLGFEIVAKGGASGRKNSFGYLAFPDEGRGSSNPLKQNFFEEGLEYRTPRILEALYRAIDEALDI